MWVMIAAKSIGRCFSCTPARTMSSTNWSEHCKRSGTGGMLKTNISRMYHPKHDTKVKD